MMKALDLAKYVIQLCITEGHPISNLQLQKILYYLQGYYMALFKRPLFQEDICAWKLGPVVPTVYRCYNYFGAEPIIIDSEQVELTGLGSIQIKLINAVIRLKSKKTAWELVNDTHNETPWCNTEQGEIINNQDIQKYFESQVGLE
ncbi:MAG: DUF4065 domain-containing protein [Clostridium sp.]|nr:DUF4065 domain-containing protein [Clostridium sp.]